MSMVSLFTHTLTVQRPTATTGIKKTFQSVGSAIPCLIQPLDDIATQQAGLAYGKGSRCYIGLTADIREGDQATDQDGIIYSVRGIRKHNYGNFPHLRLLLSDDKKV